MNLKRRQFLKLTSITAAGLSFANYVKATAVSGYTLTEDALYKTFVAPLNTHRPFVRWWWNGDRVTKVEAIRELDVMKTAGIGGVEINPIKWNEQADAIGIPALTWGSPAWLDVVESTVKEAKKKEIVCDMIVGSGWPFGGEHVPREDQGQIVIIGTRNLVGGKEYIFTQKELLSSVEPPSNYENKVSEMFMLRLAPAQMQHFEPGVSLDEQLKNEKIIVNVPPGNYVLYYLIKYTGFQQVIQGALGAMGPVINHYQQSAVQNYLDHFGDLLTSRLGPLKNYFRAFFTDSIELEGANWCNDFFEQFKQRKGYDLKPYFPYILFKVGEMGNAVNEKYGTEFSPDLQATINHVRYDFLEIKQALFQERFVGTFTAWCKKHEVLSRMQAYGMDCNAIDATMQLDIPECETWTWVPEIEEFDASPKNFGGRNYTMINKFVSSAAHLSGKQEISCEENTNTGQIFNATLERVKVTGDESALSGVTHSLLHGFNYSPLEAPFPGWLRYGSFFNERNPWWPHFRLWSDYKARLSSVFMQSTMQANIAVLHPLVDLASKHGFQRDPFPNVNYPNYVHKVWEAIHQNGNGCDYISEQVLQQASSKNSSLTFNDRSYQTLVLIEVETISIETAKAIQHFASVGGKIIFISKTPHQSAGLTNYKQQSKEIENISSKILKNHPTTTAIVPAPDKDLIIWWKAIQQQFELTPYITINNPVIHVNQVYYRTGDKDIFYFSNYSAAKSHSFTAKFSKNKTAWLWDAETGERLLYPMTADGLLQIDLGPSESKLIVFDAKQAAATYKIIKTEKAQRTVIKGPWQLTLNHINNTSQKMTQEVLADLKLSPATKDFAGSIIYKNVFNLKEITGDFYLSLGHINDVTELEINGMSIGTKWYGNHLYDISKAIKAGDNYITLKLVTTAGAYTKSLTNNKAAQEWSRGPLFGPTGLVEAPVLLRNE
jgi:hypothetical protein